MKTKYNLFVLILLQALSVPIYSQALADANTESKDLAFRVYEKAEENSNLTDYAHASKLFAEIAQQQKMPYFYQNASVASFKAGDSVRSLFYILQAEWFLGSKLDLEQNKEILYKELNLNPVISWQKMAFSWLQKVPTVMFLTFSAVIITWFSLLFLFLLFKKKKTHKLQFFFASIVLLCYLAVTFFYADYPEKNSFAMINSQTQLYLEDNLSNPLSNLSLKAGQNVKVLEKRSNWYFVSVEDSNGYTGWLPAQALWFYVLD